MAGHPHPGQVDKLLRIMGTYGTQTRTHGRGRHVNLGRLQQLDGNPQEPGRRSARGVANDKTGQGGQGGQASTQLMK